MIRFEIKQGDYEPLASLRVYHGDELLYRRLIHKVREAEVRAEITQRFGA